MRRLIVIALVCGCSPVAPAPDPPPKPVIRPEFPRLEVGQDAIIVMGTAEISRVGLEGPGEPWREGELEFLHPWLWEGDAVTVLDDRGDESDPYRWACVRVERARADELVGHNYLVRRREVRPKPR